MRRSQAEFMTLALVEEKPAQKSGKRKSKYPQVKLAPKPGRLEKKS
jgi:hypothetical protein